MNRNILLNFIFVITLIYLFVQFIIVPTNISVNYIISVLFISTLGIIAFCLKKELNPILKKQYFRISSLFLLGFVVVHFQMYLDYALGNYSMFPYDYFIDNGIINKAITVASIALYSFFIGYIIRLNKTNLNRKDDKTKNTKAKHTAHSNISLIILSYLLFIILLLTAGPGYFRGGYGEVDLGIVANYTQGFLIYSIIASIVIQCRNIKINDIKINSIVQYIKYQKISLLFLIIVYLFAVLLSGDRGPIFQIGLSYIGGYLFVTLKKLKLRVIIPIIILGILFMSFLGIFRTTSNSNETILERLSKTTKINQDSWRNYSISSSTFELATSVRAYNASVSYAERNELTFGKYQLYQIVGTIPGLGTVLRSIGGPGFLEEGAADFITDQLGAEWGMGTTCVSDIYLDFGVIGVLLAFLIFGYFNRYLEERFFSLNVYSLWTTILVFIFLQQSVYIGRSTILSLFRGAVLTFLIIKICNIINKLVFRRD